MVVGRTLRKLTQFVLESTETALPRSQSGIACFGFRGIMGNLIYDTNFDLATFLFNVFENCSIRQHDSPISRGSTIRTSGKREWVLPWSHNS